MSKSLKLWKLLITKLFPRVFVVYSRSNLVQIIMIIESAKELFMKYGIRSITMDDLARHLGMSKKTIYQEFSNKEQLIRKVIISEMEDMREQMDDISEVSENAIEEMVRISRFIIEKTRGISPTTLYDLKKYYRQIWNDLEKIRHEHSYGMIKKNIEWGINEKLYRSDIKPDFVARLYIHITRIVTDEEIFPMNEHNREDLIIDAISYHMNAIVSEKGKEEWESHKKSVFL